MNTTASARTSTNVRARTLDNVRASLSMAVSLHRSCPQESITVYG